MQNFWESSIQNPCSSKKILRTPSRLPWAWKENLHLNVGQAFWTDHGCRVLQSIARLRETVHRTCLKPCSADVDRSRTQSCQQILWCWCHNTSYNLMNWAHCLCLQKRLVSTFLCWLQRKYRCDKSGQIPKLSNEREKCKFGLTIDWGGWAR